MRILCFVVFVAALLHCVVAKERTCPRHCVSSSSGYGLPPISCPKYFQYLTEGEEFVGKLTLPDLPENETVSVDLQLSQHEFAENKNVGNFSLWYDLETVYDNIKHQEPVEYRVIFSTQKELPKVVHIAVNGQIICTAEDYPKPSEKITLRHWFTPIHGKSYKPEPLPGRTAFEWIN